MKLCKVTGTIVSTPKNNNLTGEKILLVRVIEPTGRESNETYVAIDRVDAGIGDTVLVNDEGSSARLVLENTDVPVRMVIVGVVDSIDMPKKDKN
jgi:ethanolamine utilization protein EutN